MCIIVAKKQGVNVPTKEVLETCFENNSHGAGLMYTIEDQVIIEKGFMDFESFYSRVVELDETIGLTQKSLVMHFRISTSGLVDQGNCHPYPITTNDNELRELTFETNLGMVHNGIISKHSPKSGSILNDTQLFIKNFVYDMQAKDQDFLKSDDSLRMLEIEAGSKLCFLDSEDNLYTVGKFIEDELGVLYSNDSYVPWTYLNTWGNYEYLDLVDVESASLTDDEFFYLLDNSRIVGDGNMCIDDYDNVYTINWRNNSFTFYDDLENTSLGGLI